MQKIKKIQDLTVLNSPEETDYFVGYDIDQTDPDKATVLIPVSKGRNIIVDSITALEALTGTVDGQVIKVKGYYAGVPLEMPDYHVKPDSVKTPNGGSVIARPEGGNFEWPEITSVDPRQFGAKGDASYNASTNTVISLGTDDTVAIQNAINTGLDLYFGGGVYHITNTLTMRNQSLIGNLNTGADEQYRNTVLLMTEPKPIIQNDVSDLLIMNIKSLRLVFENSVAKDVDTVGIYFRDQFPYNYLIEDVRVVNATYGLSDVSGSFQSNIKNSIFRQCDFGIYKIGGTTIKFDTVQCSEGGFGFWIENVLSSTFINCASDNNTAENKFKDIPALSVVGWDGEGNTIGNFGGLFVIENCEGLFNGFTGVQNRMVVTGANPSSLFYVINSKMELSGIIPNYNKDSSNLTFTGDTLGGSGTIVRCEGSRVKISNSYLQSPEIEVGSVAIESYTLFNVGSVMGDLIYTNTYIEPATGTADDTTVDATELVPLGVYQDYDNVTGSRALNTLYVNSEDRPITLYLNFIASSPGEFSGILELEAVTVQAFNLNADIAGRRQCMTTVVPSGKSYKVTATNATVDIWIELKTN